MRVFMSGGTTGKSRPTFYTQWDREVGALLTARALYMQGIRPGDVVLNSWAYGTTTARSCSTRPCTVGSTASSLTTGTGNVTSSERQVELAIEYQAAAILTTGDYLLRLADVAREMGYDPATDFKLHALPNIGDRALLESTFGVECFDSYGFHEVQWVSVECPAHDGLHIFEDAFVVQIVDPETGEPLPDGELGVDLHHRALQDREPAIPLQHHGPVVPLPARAVRVRELAAQDGPVRGPRRQHGEAARRERLARGRRRARARGRRASTPDWFVRAVRRRRPRRADRSRWSASATRPPSRRSPTAVETRLKDRLGVRIAVEVVAPGALDAWTEVDVSPKLKRFRDDGRLTDASTTLSQRVHRPTDARCGTARSPRRGCR